MKNMSYFLYLKQSFRRRPMWHLNIYVIITCAYSAAFVFHLPGQQQLRMEPTAYQYGKRRNFSYSKCG